VAQASANKPIRWAMALSVALHIAVLIAIGLVSLHTDEGEQVPELRLNVELQDGHDSERETPPAEKRAAALMARSTEMQPPTPPAAPPVHAEPFPSAAASTPEPGISESSNDPSPLHVESEAPSGAPGDAEVLVASADSSYDVPQPAETPQPRAEEIEIPQAQQATLTRWITKEAQGLQDSDLTQARMTWQHDGREYVAHLTRQPAVESTAIERVAVEIDTEQDGKRLRTRLQMKRLAFSHFTQLVDRWDPDIQFHDDEIVGRFHSNSQIFVGYDRNVAPKFLGKVTTAAGGFAVASSRGRKRSDEIFRAGIETRSGRISLPSKLLPPRAGQEETRAVAFAHDVRITFYADGTFGWRNPNADAPEQIQPISTTAPVYLLGAPGATMYVRGNVVGKVLVYSPERIVIENDLVYGHDPRVSADADDYLGLVSDRVIEIAGRKVTGPGDLEIHAAVYAKRRFIVREEQSSPTGTLIILGSLTAGSLSATEPRYATRIEFDSRFERLRPPGFPVTNRYEIDEWDPRWETVEQPTLQAADGSETPPTSASAP